jgi:ABC-type lipoprotein export system ATPase subunit
VRPEIGRHAVIRLEGLGKQFGGEPPFEALANVHLSVLEGDWLAIVGPSGSGKSTLLNIIGCLDVPSSGSYHFDGIDVAGLSDGQRAGIRSHGIGFVFQSFHLLTHRSVEENVMLADIYRRGQRSDRRARVAAVLNQVGLSQRVTSSPVKLSGGERQRVAIARALLGTPRVLLCDEPTGNLDSVTTSGVLDLLKALNAQGMTIVTITHSADVASRANRTVRMTDGQLTNVPPDDEEESPK